ATQSFLPARGARSRRHILRQVFAIFVGGRFLEIAFEMVNDAFEVQPLCRAPGCRIAVQNQVLHLARKILEWSVEIESMRQRRYFQRALQIARRAARSKAAFE